jgi:hypothetical protein
MQQPMANHGSGRSPLSLAGVVRPVLLALLASLLIHPNLFASQVRPLNLEEMVQRSGRIFSGRCVQVRVAEDPGTHQRATFVTFAVDRTVKGGGPPRVTIKILGEQGWPGKRETGIEGAPRYMEGEEVVLFLYGDSRSGFTSPVGFGQGKFSVVRDKNGQRLALNEFGNRGLLERLSPRAEERLKGRAARHRGRPEIPPDDLLEMVKSLLP